MSMQVSAIADGEGQIILDFERLLNWQPDAMTRLGDLSGAVRGLRVSVPVRFSPG